MGMWIERKDKKTLFLQQLMSLRSQVLVLRGARQVGKSSFVVKALGELADHPQIRLNLASKGKTTIDGLEYFGRDFFGAQEDASQFLFNIGLQLGDLGKLERPAIVFVDEADRHPVCLEAVQAIAGLSDTLKAVFTGSNLENIPVKNAATGRKRYFDLYPITFGDFLTAHGKDTEIRYLEQLDPRDKVYSEMHHAELTRLFDVYLRLGGMPRVVDAFVDPAGSAQAIPGIISDLVSTIEDNVKQVIGEKAAFYEYEDVLRKLALLSMETLKFTNLQVQHERRSDARMLVNKTVGARVAHKIRLYESGSDLSKYIIFDAGVANCLINGADLLGGRITDPHLALLYETVVGDEIVASMTSRDDLFYWKSKRGAQVDFMLKSPRFAAIDVKSSRGDTRSLDSCAVFESDLECIVRIGKIPPSVDADHVATIPALGLSRKIPLLNLPHYLAGRLTELLSRL